LRTRCTIGVAAGQLQVDLLAELGGEVADEAREAEEDRLDLDHAHLHHHRLQRLRGARELLHHLREARDVRLLDERLERGAVHDELAHVVHELVEALRIDAHGAARRLLVLGRGRGSRVGRAGDLELGRVRRVDRDGRDLVD
jgi:hypothetical protein